MKVALAALGIYYGKVTYSQALRVHGVSPDSYARFINLNPKAIVNAAPPESRLVLGQILSDDHKFQLFKMEEWFIQQQYDRVFGRIPGQKQDRFYQGTFLHPENLEVIAYYALTVNNPMMKSADREKIIQSIMELPKDAYYYFRRIGLSRLMYLERGSAQGSPLSVWELFDSRYTKETGDKSLFDLTQPVHLHKWGTPVSAPRSYWNNPDNVAEAIYHSLTENDKRLESMDRATVVAGIQNLPARLHKYFRQLGLGGLMNHGVQGDQKNSSLEILNIFDRAYMEKSKDPSSLFSSSAPPYVQPDKRNRIVRQIAA